MRRLPLRRRPAKCALSIPAEPAPNAMPANARARPAPPIQEWVGAPIMEAETKTDGDTVTGLVTIHANTTGLPLIGLRYVR